MIIGKYSGIDVYDKIPKGWKIKTKNWGRDNMSLIWNVKSLFGGEYKNGLIKEVKENE